MKSEFIKFDNVKILLNNSNLNMDSDSPSSEHGFSLISSDAKRTRKRKVEGKDNVRKTRKKKHKTDSDEKRKKVGDDPAKLDFEEAKDTESNSEPDNEEVTDEFVSAIFRSSTIC